jgi:hypothetical protein
LQFFPQTPNPIAVTGTILNAIGIILGGILAFSLRRQPAASTQMAIKGLLGVATVFVGLRLTWISLGGTFWTFGKQLLIVVLALTLGRLTGHLVGFQKSLNKLGQFAKQKMAGAAEGKTQSWSDGFSTGAILYCVTPLAIIGPLLDGLSDQWHPLAIKAVMDGLATMSFVAIFGWSIVLSVIPVIAWQGTIALAARMIEPHVAHSALLDSVNATGGLLVFCVALIILELKKIELADYLPSLAFAPLLTWIWR